MTELWYSSCIFLCLASYVSGVTWRHTRFYRQHLPSAKHPTSSNVRHLLNCDVVWGDAAPRDTPFSGKSQKDMWRSNWSVGRGSLPRRDPRSTQLGFSTLILPYQPLLIDPSWLGARSKTCVYAQVVCV